MTVTKSSLHTFVVHKLKGWKVAYQESSLKVTKICSCSNLKECTQMQLQLAIWCIFLTRPCSWVLERHLERFDAYKSRNIFCECMLCQNIGFWWVVTFFQKVLLKIQSVVFFLKIRMSLSVSVNPEKCHLIHMLLGQWIVYQSICI